MNLVETIDILGRSLMKIEQELDGRERTKTDEQLSGALWHCRGLLSILYEAAVTASDTPPAA